MGTGRLDAGAFYWTDFLYDDHGGRGTQTKPPATGLAPPAGTYAYPAGHAANNGADIFRVGIGLDAAATYWRVDWTTLVEPSVPIALFALDTDDNTGTGTAAWPAGAGLRSAGTDRFLLISGRDAWLVDAKGARQTVGSLGGSLIVDRAARSFVVRLPRSALLARGTWRVRVAAGLANAAGDGFAPVGLDLGALPGEPPVYNIGFRADAQEPTRFNLWRDEARPRPSASAVTCRRSRAASIGARSALDSRASADRVLESRRSSSDKASWGRPTTSIKATCGRTSAVAYSRTRSTFPLPTPHRAPRP
jgi:hypothetical protein